MAHEIESEAELRALMGEPIHPAVVVKSTPLLTEPLQRYIERAPFACLATYAADGSTDLSPRGDPPGFVKVIDASTLFLPERPGNGRLDSIVNIIATGRLSLLFMIPGTLETVRVNGTGKVTTDPALLEACAVAGKLPRLGVLITVVEAFGHCSKALRRAKLWQEDYRSRAGVPSLAEMMTAHLETNADLDAALAEGIERDVRERMY